MSEKNTFQKPLMLYDGDCRFCKHWIERGKRITKDTILYRPYQETLDIHSELTKQDCEKAVWLILSDGSRISGAHAVFKALNLAGRYKVFLWFYEHMPLFGRASEFFYQWIAHYR